MTLVVPGQAHRQGVGARVGQSPRCQLRQDHPQVLEVALAAVDQPARQLLPADLPRGEDPGERPLVAQRPPVGEGPQVGQVLRVVLVDLHRPDVLGVELVIVLRPAGHQEVDPVRQDRGKHQAVGAALRQGGLGLVKRVDDDDDRSVAERRRVAEQAEQEPGVPQALRGQLVDVEPEPGDQLGAEVADERLGRADVRAGEVEVVQPAVAADQVGRERRLPDARLPADQHVAPREGIVAKVPAQLVDDEAPAHEVPRAVVDQGQELPVAHVAPQRGRDAGVQVDDKVPAGDEGVAARFRRLAELAAALPVPCHASVWDARVPREQPREPSRASPGPGAGRSGSGPGPRRAPRARPRGRRRGRSPGWPR